MTSQRSRRGDSGGLQVLPSKIPDAGQGLFADRPFAAGELLCVYSGKAVPLAQVLRGASQGLFNPSWPVCVSRVGFRCLDKSASVATYMFLSEEMS